MSETPQQAYISKVHLKGYKSIRDLEIDFKPGLNIIIGPNGSGKTNFLEFLEKVMFKAIPEQRDIFSAIVNIFNNGRNYSWEIDGIYNEEMSRKIYNYASNINQKLIDKDNNDILVEANYTYPVGYSDVKVKKIDINKFWASIFPILKIQFQIPQNLPFFDTPFSGNNATFKENKIFISYNRFIQESLSKVAFEKNNENGKDFIKKQFEVKTKVLKSLSQFTPIKNFRLKNEFSVSESNKEIQLSFLFFEFNVNNSWINWEYLSDGTKRLFYIVHEAAFFDNGILMVEEPELGIHPDQLYKLMDFLKEQSKEKQIIITTHSPQVLNILNENELDRIVVTRYDGENGTKMFKLSEKEQGHVRNYMKHEASISDYWIQSGFEHEKEEVES